MEGMENRYKKLSLTEAKDLFQTWRENNERRSEDVMELWYSIPSNKFDKLGTEKYIILEQVIVAALDCSLIPAANYCILMLLAQFPGSLRVLKYEAMKLEAEERYDEALQLLDSIIQKDETNSAPRKRRIAIIKAMGRIPEAIKELKDYLQRFMSDQEGWQELSNLYLQEQDYAKAAFCMEELILHNPHNHLIHQRLADIRYTQGGYENMEVARAYYLLAVKLNSNNIRALYGVFLTSNNILNSQKCHATKKKEANKLMQWALTQVQQKYEAASKDASSSAVSSLEAMMGAIQIS